jgi:predicted GNAT family acetyltransferase
VLHYCFQFYIFGEKMDIRTAKHSDHAAIVDFQIRMAKETEDLALDPNLVSKGVEAVLKDSNKGIYYIVEDNSDVVASLLTTYEWSDWRNGLVLWIQSVYVLPGYRGKGVYKSMYHHLKSKVESNSELLGLRLYVEKDNKNAQKVYSKLGMDGEHYQMFEWFA